MNGALALVETLYQNGVDHVFALPGTTITDIYDVFYDFKGIRLVTARHEQVAGFMADGYARITGRTGVCMASRGPGAANLAIAAHNAYAESCPMVVIVGQVSEDIYEKNAFEEVDLVSFFRPITKWATEIHDARRIPEIINRAIYVSKSGKPGPVMVSIPLNIQQQQGAYCVPEPIPVTRYSAAKEQITAAVELIRNKSRPVILVGSGLQWSGGTDQLLEFAERLSCPIVVSYARKSVVPNNHPLFAGVTGLGMNEGTKELVDASDLVVSVGFKFSEFSTLRYQLLPPGIDIVQIDVDPLEIGRVYSPKIGLVGDAAEILKQLVQGLSVSPPAGEQRLEEQSDKRLENIRQQIPEEEQSTLSGKILSCLQDLLDEETTIVSDASTFGNWIYKYLKFPFINTFFKASGGSMGWGFPAAMGMKLANPARKVVNIAGDGAFMMTLQDLETAVREDIGVINVVMNNFSYGNVKARQINYYNGRIIGSTYNNPDFGSLAKLFGAYGISVTSPEQFVSAYQAALKSGKPSVIEVIQSVDEGMPRGHKPPTAH